MAKLTITIEDEVEGLAFHIESENEGGAVTPATVYSEMLWEILDVEALKKASMLIAYTVNKNKKGE